MRFVLLLPLAAACLGAAPAPAPLPVHVGGRTMDQAGGALGFGWPGIYFESRFRGTSITVRLDAPADHLRLLVDGEEKLLFKGPGPVETTLRGLSDGDHVARLEKLTETQSGGSSFRGFFPGRGTRALPTRPRTRAIEFIGDSYTVGYGNTSTTRQCTPKEIHERTDTQQAFGALVAKRIDADYRIFAYSGFGIVRNYAGGVPALSLPAIYSRARPSDGAPSAAADGAWRPQLIVINLGTNDFSTPLKPGERWADQAALRTAWRAAYVEFVRKLRLRHPQARFILMGSDAFFGEVRQVADTLGGGVTAIRFDGLDLGGCDWHPSLADHRRLAELVADTAEQLHVWPGKVRQAAPAS